MRFYLLNSTFSTSIIVLGTMIDNFSKCCITVRTLFSLQTEMENF